MKFKLVEQNLYEYIDPAYIELIQKAKEEDGKFVFNTFTDGKKVSLPKDVGNALANIVFKIDEDETVFETEEDLNLQHWIETNFYRLYDYEV